MAKSITDIQKKSDEKRGVKSKGFKLPLATISAIERLASETGKSQAAIITGAIELYEKSLR